MLELNLEIAPDQFAESEIKGIPQLAGCKLKARRPSYEELVKDVSLSGEPWVKLRVGLIAGWEGANGEPSPFQDPRTTPPTPIPFSANAFAKACQKYPTLLNEALAAAAKTFSDMPNEASLGN